MGVCRSLVSLNDAKAFLFMTTLPSPGAFNCPDSSRGGKGSQVNLPVSQLLHSERIVKLHMKTAYLKLFTIVNEMPLWTLTFSSPRKQNHRFHLEGTTSHGYTSLTQ